MYIVYAWYYCCCSNIMHNIVVHNIAREGIKILYILYDTWNARNNVVYKIQIWWEGGYIIRTHIILRLRLTYFTIVIMK